MFLNVHCSGFIMPMKLEKMEEKKFTENRLLRLNKRVIALSTHTKKSLRKTTADNFTIKKMK